MPGDEPRPVSGFGHLRVNAWLAAHRSLSQPSHVLRRLSTPRHPPSTLSNLTTFLSRRLLENYFSSLGQSLVTTFLKLSKIFWSGESGQALLPGPRPAVYRKVRCRCSASHCAGVGPAWNTS